jgi:hypothetical protein
MKSVEWVSDIPSWPQSNDDGIAYVVQVHGMEKRNVKALLGDVRLYLRCTYTVFALYLH